MKIHIRHAQINPWQAMARGFSLVELLCTAAISSILLCGAMPVFKDLRADQLLRAIASQLETDIQYARSLAMTNSQPVRLEVNTSETAGTCYIIHNGGNKACTCNPGSVPSCSDGTRVLRLVELPANSGIKLTGPARPIVFDPNKGTISPTATLRLTDMDGRAIHQVVNILGRTRSCTTGVKVSGIRAC